MLLLLLEYYFGRKQFRRTIQLGLFQAWILENQQDLNTLSDCLVYCSTLAGECVCHHLLWDRMWHESCSAKPYKRFFFDSSDESCFLDLTAGLSVVTTCHFHGHKVVTIDLKCCEQQIVRNKFYLLLKIPCRLLRLSFKQLLLCFLCKHLLMSWAWRLQVQSFPQTRKWSWLMVDIGSSKPLGMLISSSSFFTWSHSFHVLVFALCQSTLFRFCSGHVPLEAPAMGQTSPLHPPCPQSRLAAMTPSVTKVAQPSWAPHQEMPNLLKHIQRNYIYCHNRQALNTDLSEE